jgi:hypothetical protein
MHWEVGLAKDLSAPLYVPFYAIINFFVRSAKCPGSCPRLGITALDGFFWNLTVEYFCKSVKKIQVLLKSDENNGYEGICTFMIHLAEVFSEWEMFQMKVVEKIETWFYIQ